MTSGCTVLVIRTGLVNKKAQIIPSGLFIAITEPFPDNNENICRVNQFIIYRGKSMHKDILYACTLTQHTYYPGTINCKYLYQMSYD